MFRPPRVRPPFISVVVLVAMAATAQAQDSRSANRSGRPAAGGLGLDLFGGAAASWPTAKDSFKAVKLPSRPIDFGGGTRVTGLWGGMFLQVAGARWRDTGERVFIDSDGTTFPLGIPLRVSATFMDGTVGLKRPFSETRTPYFAYVGGGAGMLRYSETSPFAEAGEDLEVRKVSYHALVGVEIPIVRRLAAVVEAKYRYVPGLLGDGGASAVLGEKSLGGFNAALGLSFGFGGRSSASRGRNTATPSTPAPAPPSVQVPNSESAARVILQAAPVYILPDATRTPLRTLAAGTRVRVLAQQGDWDQIEFPDAQWGPRVGWIQRRFVR